MVELLKEAKKIFNGKKITTVVSEVTSSLLWDIFMHILNLINTQNIIINNYIEFNKIQICAKQKLPVNILNYFEDIVVHFESVKGINNDFFIKTIVNKMKMLK